MSERRDPFTVPADCDEQGVLHLDMPRKQYQAISKARFAGQRVDITIAVRKTKRTVRANAAFHAGACEWGQSKGLAGAALTQWVEDLKDDLLGLTFGYVVRQSPLTGEITRRLVEPHTSDLSVEQFGELFDVAIVAAAEAGHVWRLPEEFKARKARAAA